MEFNYANTTRIRHHVFDVVKNMESATIAIAK